MDEQQNAIAIAEFKGNMNAMCAENNAMESRIDVSFAQIRTDMERRDKETIQREKENQRWVVGLVLACTAIVVGAVALL